MKKWIIILVVFAIVVLPFAGYFFITDYLSPQKANTGNQMNNADPSQATDSFVQVIPISHATMVLDFGGQTIYTDPVGGGGVFTGQKSPNLILITDIHQDHLDADTLSAISKEDTIIVAPQAVVDMLPKNIPGTIVVMHNGEKKEELGIEIEAIPMYNIPESSDAFHTKGRGNGYVISNEGKRMYIAGDTDAVPEMKALQNIDVAFVPMNPPYTMSVEEAADGVLAFKPKVVHPYHYRSPNGLNDINKFKELVESKDRNIKVELLNFYPNQ